MKENNTEIGHGRHLYLYQESQTKAPTSEV